MRRRDFIKLAGGAAATWPLSARAQQAVLPVIAFVSGRGREDSTRYGEAFRKGLAEASVVESQGATVEYHWLDGQYDQLTALMADLTNRRVAIIATPGSTVASLAAKAATTMIPIAFGVGEDPVTLGLVASLARPGSNATGINFFAAEIASKQLDLLRELVPKAQRIAVLVNPANPTNSEAALRDVRQAASTLGLQIQPLSAGTVGEIEGAFASLMREQAEALLIGPDAYLTSRRVQIAILPARHGIPTAGASRDLVEAGQLISYGTDTADMYRQVGVYAGRILKGEKPAQLPVQQSTKFEFVMNSSTAKTLGLEIPPSLLLRADEVIE